MAWAEQGSEQKVSKALQKSGTSRNDVFAGLVQHVETQPYVTFKPILEARVM